MVSPLISYLHSATEGFEVWYEILLQQMGDLFWG